VALVAEIVETIVEFAKTVYIKQLSQPKESFIHTVCEPADKELNV